MKMNKPDNIEKYQGNYSESGFWNKVKKVALKAGAKVIYVALILYYELADPNVSPKEKAIIILDYLQLVSPPPGRRSESRTVEVSEMSRGLKIMAKELKIPLIALSQLSRQVESRTGKRPQLSDLRESGSIEQDADIVMFLDRSADEAEASRDDRPDEGVTRIVVAKNRSGPIGDVDLMFLPASTKFYELDGAHAEE